MRVWMLIPQFYPFTGGTERQCLKLSRALIERGVDVRVVTRRANRGLAREETIESVPVVRLPRTVAEGDLFSWGAYLRRRRDEFDVLHAHLLGPNVAVGARAGRALDKPFVVKIANSGERFDLTELERRVRWPLRAWIRNGVFRADAVVAIASSIRQELLAAGIPESRIASIPNGVEPLPAATPGIKLQRRRELDLPADAVIVLKVGTLGRKKGTGVLLDAWQRLAERHANAVLVSVGGKSIPSELAPAIEACGNSVRFVMNQPDGVLPYLQAADVFVLPSFAEGLSNALLEAQVCGLPSVVTRVGGNTDVVEDGENGFVIGPGDAAELAARLGVLVEDEALRQRMSAKSLTAVAPFHMDSVAERYVELYSRLIGERG